MAILGISANRLLGLWPGLPAAWLRGQLGGLLIALGFAVVLEIALLSTTVWPLWFGPTPVSVVWFCVALYWLVAVLPTFRQGTLGIRDAQSGDVGRLDLLREAQREYLTGNWFEAEERLFSLLDGDASDAEVQLMLATLYRRLGRATEAYRHLTLADEHDGVGKWQWEISQERHLLKVRQKGVDTVGEGLRTAANAA